MNQTDGTPDNRPADSADFTNFTSPSLMYGYYPAGDSEDRLRPLQVDSQGRPVLSPDSVSGPGGGSSADTAPPVAQSQNTQVLNTGSSFTLQQLAGVVSTDEVERALVQCNDNTVLFRYSGNVYDNYSACFRLNQGVLYEFTKAEVQTVRFGIQTGTATLTFQLFGVAEISGGEEEG